MGSIESLRRLLDPLAARIRLMLARGIVRLVTDGTKAQELQVSLLAHELRDKLERFQNYGLTSVPLPPSANGEGAEALVGFLGGDRSHGIVIAVEDRRYRVKGLAGGEVCLYDDQGSRVHLKRGGAILVSALTVTVDAVTAITLDGGGSTIELDASAITITAPAIDLVKS